MKYLWTEDTGAGLHFWKLVNQLFFDNALVVESKESNQGVLYSLTSLNAKEEDEYYIADLIGMDVVLEDGSKFGTLKDVMETGANDVYVVEDAKGEEILLPAIRECILDVDVEKNVMTIHLMKGLI